MDLVDADALVSPAVREAIDALDPPAEDAALVRVALVAAAGIDEMPASVRAMMLPQHAGILLRALDGLEKRAAGRRKGGGGPKRGMSPLEELRAARARRPRAG